MKLNYFEIKRLIESLSLDDIDIIKRRRTGPCFESTLPDKFKHLSLKQIKEYILSNILGKFYERDQGCIVIDTIYLKDLIEYLKSKILGDIYLSALEYILDINFEKNLKGDIYAYSKGKDLHILFNLDGTLLIDINAKPVKIKYYHKGKAYIATFMIKSDVTEYQPRYNESSMIKLKCLTKSGYWYTQYADKIEDEKKEPSIHDCSCRTVLYNGMTEKQLKNVMFSLSKNEYDKFIKSNNINPKGTIYEIHVGHNFKKLQYNLFDAIKDESNSLYSFQAINISKWLEFFKEKHDKLKNKEEEFYCFEGYCNTEIGENDDIIPNSEFEKYLNKKIPLYADNPNLIGNAVIDKIDNYGVHVKCSVPKNDIFVKTNIIPNIENGSLKYLGHATSIYPVNFDTVPRIYVVQCLHSINILTINYNKKCIIWPPKKLATSKVVGNLDKIKDNDCQKEYAIEDIASKNILINAKTENEAIEIIRYFFNNNVNLNEFTLEDNGWYMYGSKSCYGINNGYITLKSKEFIDKKYKVIFIDEIKKGVI